MAATDSPGQVEILHLQRTIGNHAVQRLLQRISHPRSAAIQRTKLSIQRNGPGAAPAAAPPSLAANELVLTAGPYFNHWVALLMFRASIKSKIEGWGLSFDESAVNAKEVTIDATPTKAVLLTWPSAWGTRPTTTNIPPTLAPIDAKAAVTAIHGLKGWGKVPATDQTILDNMLGGETNALSTTARDHLRPTFTDLKAKSEDDQAKALGGLISAKDALPAVVDEPVTTAKTAYDLDGPTEQKGYAFKGKTADAEKWLIKFKDGIQTPIFAPKAPEPGYHNHSVAQTADAAAYLPKSARAVITSIVLNAVTNPDDAHWAAEYERPDFHSYMTAGAAGVVTIYPNEDSKPMPNENYMQGTMTHETGHTWAYKTWGTDEAKGKWVDWKTAMDADKVAVSGYAKASIAEDVAETIQIYVTTRGSPRFEEYRRIVPNRFAILDKEYK